MAVYADTRYLHVPARFAAYADKNDMSVMLREMRQEIVDKYRVIAEGQGQVGAGSSAEAALLQRFFQEIKTASKLGEMGTDTSFLPTALTMQIIQNATKMGGYGSANTNWTHAFFRGMGENQGIYFEREMANITAAALNLGGANTTGNSLMMGDETVNVGGMSAKALGNIMSQVSKGTLKSIEAQTQKWAQQAAKASNRYVTVGVSGKIDVSGLNAEFTLTATGNPTLDHIIQLLSKATFTAKSYASVTTQYVDILKQVFTQESTRHELHLGSTNENRIFLDMLMKFGHLPYAVAVSFYYRTLNSRSKVVREELSRLRWIYELTGYGQTYTNITQDLQRRLNLESGMGAKYLIYNDPASGNIYVRSTAELINQAMAEFARYLSGQSSVIGKYIVSSGIQSV